MISYGDQSTGILLAGSTSTCKFIMFLWIIHSID
jgi:hypothetical protein